MQFLLINGSASRAHSLNVQAGILLGTFGICSSISVNTGFSNWPPLSHVPIESGFIFPAKEHVFQSEQKAMSTPQLLVSILRD